MVDCFNSQKLKDLGQNNKLFGCRFSITKNKRGINCFPRRFGSEMDEI